MIFIVLSSLETVHDTVQYRYCIFSLLNIEDWANTLESITFIGKRERERNLQMIPIRQFIYHLTDKFFVSCPAHPNPLIRNTGNYTLEDLHRQYTKYRHKRIKHILH